jgi:hypothetical protein
MILEAILFKEKCTAIPKNVKKIKIKEDVSVFPMRAINKLDSFLNDFL